MFKEEFNAPLNKVNQAFNQGFASRVWEDVGKRCVACGNCTAVCPTCYCFDVLDDMDLSLNEGLRYRIWNSCQMDDFAKVAGVRISGRKGLTASATVITENSNIRWISLTVISAPDAADAVEAVWPR